MDPPRHPGQLTIKKLLAFAALPALAVLVGACHYDHFEAQHSLAGLVNTCDPALESTYTATVRYIMANDCTACHNSLSSSGNISLDNYTGVKGSAESGKLLGAIEHQIGFKAMPPASKIKDCEVEKIRAWIINGLKE